MRLRRMVAPRLRLIAARIGRRREVRIRIRSPSRLALVLTMWGGTCLPPRYPSKCNKIIPVHLRTMARWSLIRFPGRSRLLSSTFPFLFWSFHFCGIQCMCIAGDYFCYYFISCFSHDLTYYLCSCAAYLLYLVTYLYPVFDFCYAKSCMYCCIACRA